jgi:hypothetical protein
MNYKINNTEEIENIYHINKKIIYNIIKYVSESNINNNLNIINQIIFKKLKNNLQNMYLTIDNYNIKKYKFLFQYKNFNSNFEDNFINLIYLNCSNISEINTLSEDLVNLKILNAQE